MTMRRAFAMAMVGLLVLGAACSKKAPTKDEEKSALTTALETHLATRSGLNRGAMDVEIKTFQVTGNQAEAEVEFRAKGAPASMQVIYQFERGTPEQLWTVKGSRPSGGMQHPATGETGAPPSGGMTPGSPVMGLPGPPGIGSGAGQGALPPGHPPMTTPPPKQEKAPAKNQ